MLVLLAAAALRAGGCLQSSKDRYIADYQPLNDRLVKVNREMVQAINTAPERSSQRLATELAPLSRELTRLSRQIAALETPDDLRQESDALTSRLRRTGARADRTVVFARRSDGPALSAETRRLADDVNGVIRATRRLARATGAAG